MSDSPQNTSKQVYHHEIFLLLLVLLLANAHEYGNPNINATVYGNEHDNSAGSIFSPRMDFEQWRPLTGRGDPLRNDPTYDYEPPVLERVHYWADDTKVEREHRPEKKSEVLMLGVSSRKPSVTSRPPHTPPRRLNQFRQPPPKYEDYTYKLSETYPMTILVPPPLPPPGHQPPLFVLNQPKASTMPFKSETTSSLYKDTTKNPEEVTSLYALQASNLIYQASTISHNWNHNTSETLPLQNIVTSDYAGWGPTTPINEYENANDTHNLISNDQIEIIKHPYSFYRPMLSESPPPPPEKQKHTISTFLPTALPPDPTKPEPSTNSPTEATWPTDQTTYESSTLNPDYYEDATIETITAPIIQPAINTQAAINNQYEMNIFDMLGPMMSMPIVDGPERPEDNLYAHATENMQVFKEKKPDNVMKLESMQIMQPPPSFETAENTMVAKRPSPDSNPIINKLLYNKASLHTHDPYLHMRYTTPVSASSTVDTSDIVKPTTESSIPMYLIIQGHSKVKTYSSKPKPVAEDKHTSNNEIPKPNETNEVKHLHPKQKFAKKLNITTEEGRKGKAQNLKALVDNGHGSIEIQETDIGIKYDVSDGSDVPLEVYRKGIVETEDNNYKYANKISKTESNTRSKRQIDLEDLLPFDEDSLEELVYNYFDGKKNHTGFTGALAQAVTSDTVAAIDELEDDDDDGSETNQDGDGR